MQFIPNASHIYKQLNVSYYYKLLKEIYHLDPIYIKSKLFIQFWNFKCLVSIKYKILFISEREKGEGSNSMKTTYYFDN